MIVTGIEELSRTKSKIYLDEAFAFVLYKGELRLYGICEGNKLQEEDYQKITGEVLPKRATLRCMNLLKSRDYTESQLREKLRQGMYPQKSVDAALEYVKAYGYVDDLRFALAYIENQREKKSRRVMEMDLMRKGIDAARIGEAFGMQEEAGNMPDEEALARRLLAKKRFDDGTGDYKERQKMAAFLYRKGIGSDTISRVLRQQ